MISGSCNAAAVGPARGSTPAAKPTTPRPATTATVERDSSAPTKLSAAMRTVARTIARTRCQVVPTGPDSARNTPGMTA